MEAHEADAVFARIAVLFEDWQPNDELVKFWLDQIGKFPSRDAALKAVDEHRASSGWKKPQLPKIRALVERFTVESGERAADIGYSGYYVICTEAPTYRPSRLGWFVPIIFGNTSDVPADPVLHEIATKLAEKHAHLYGGKWVIYTGSNDHAMNARSRELQRGDAR